MIALKDKNGKTLLELDEHQFPLQIPAEQNFGTYRIFLNYTKNEDGEKIVKSINVAK